MLYNFSIKYLLMFIERSLSAKSSQLLPLLAPHESPSNIRSLSKSPTRTSPLSCLIFRFDSTSPLYPPFEALLLSLSCFYRRLLLCKHRYREHTRRHTFRTRVRGYEWCSLWFWNSSVLRRGLEGICRKCSFLGFSWCGGSQGRRGRRGWVEE